MPPVSHPPSPPSSPFYTVDHPLKTPTHDLMHVPDCRLDRPTTTGPNGEKKGAGVRVCGGGVLTGRQEEGGNSPVREREGSADKERTCLFIHGQFHFCQVTLHPSQAHISVLTLLRGA